jgi:hypothetical protein
MKISTRTIISIIVAASSLALCLIWYDYKLFIILMLFGWALNIDNKITE